LNHEYLVELQSEIPNSFRTKMACDSLDINIEEKSKHKLLIEGIKVPNDWSIGLILGASGSGKTTLAKEIFGDDCFDDTINESKPIIDQLPKDLKYNDCANLLSGIGLTSVPCWVRPVYTLSNGQKARAKAVLQMTKNKDISVIDEWTSVVDRQVAKVMSHCVQKFARRNKKKIVLCSCHYDILEWLNPDWVIDCNDQKFYNRDLKKKEKNNLSLLSKKSVKTHGGILASIII